MSFLKKMRDFVEGNYLYFNKPHNAAHINEQAMWRAYQCHDCLTAGKCRICNCKTPNMFFSPNKEDSAKKWGKMLGANDWEAFKLSNPEYRLFEKANKDKKKIEDAGNQFYREQQKFLGYTPPVADPLFAHNQRQGKEGIVTTAVGDSLDESSSFTILQSTIRREETDSSDGLRDEGGDAARDGQDHESFSERNDDSGTEIIDDLEKEN